MFPPMPTETDKPSLEGLVSRYWFPLKQRCNTLLHNTVAAEEVTRESLAKLAAQLEEGAESNEWLETLYRDSTARCLERLTGRKGRDTQWLGQLEHQGETEPGDGRQAQRERLLDLLGRTAPENRPAVIMRYLEGLSLDSIARLTGQTNEQAQAQLTRFHEKADAFLENRGEPPLDPPPQSDCPDDLRLHRMLAGEQEGLADTRAHLEQHPECAQRLRDLEQARDAALAGVDQAAIIEAVERSIERIARKKPGPRMGLSHFLAPAMAVALAIGLVAWLSWPESLPREENPLILQQGFSLEAFVAGDPDASALVDGQTVPAGTELRFRLGAAAPVRARLSALRERGPVLPIGPAEQLTQSLHPGELVEIPPRHKLGPDPGLERIFALFCPLGGPLLYFNQGLDYAFQPGLDGKRDLARAYSSAPRNCQLRSLILRRSANPAE